MYILYICMGVGLRESIGKCCRESIKLRSSTKAKILLLQLYYARLYGLRLSYDKLLNMVLDEYLEHVLKVDSWEKLKRLVG